MTFSGLTDDRLALHELVMNYGDAVTRTDSSDWGNTWAENAIWSVQNFPGLEKVEGRNEIVKRWQDAMKNYKYIVFTAHLGSLKINGNLAEGTTYTIEVSTDVEGKKLKFMVNILIILLKLIISGILKKELFQFFIQHKIKNKN